MKAQKQRKLKEYRLSCLFLVEVALNKVKCGLFRLVIMLLIAILNQKYGFFCLNFFIHIFYKCLVQGIQYEMKLA